MNNSIRNLQNIINAPLYQHLISPAALNKLRNIINQPYTANAPFRVKKNDLSSYFANVSKAYHSGKGDDFESVAVVYGNSRVTRRITTSFSCLIRKQTFSRTQ